MNQRSTRKPVVGSRATPGAPRRVAGRGPAPAEHPPPTDAAATRETRTHGDADTTAEESPRAGGPLAGGRSFRILAGVAAVLALLLVLLAVLLWLPGEDDASAGWTHVAGETWHAPTDAEHPVTVDPVAWRTATDAAATAVTDILTVNWKDYDEHRAQVAELMTDRFAEEYEITAGDSREKFIASKADYDFVVVGQSVVSAAEDEVTALLFLNQYVYKGEGEDRVGPDVYQVRVMVTAVRQDGEWLVDSLDAL